MERKKEATEYTRRKNKQLLENMNPENLRVENEDVKEVKRNMLLELGDEELKDENGNAIWNRKLQNMLTREEAPDTGNPYLWRSCRNGYLAGVVEMAKDFYIVLGVDNNKNTVVSVSNENIYKGKCK